jgi:hypothetical protein
VARTLKCSGKESEAFDSDAMEVAQAASCNAPTRPPYHHCLPKDGSVGVGVGVGVLSSLLAGVIDIRTLLTAASPASWER